MQYRRMVDLLSIKSCSVEIKESILLIVDHLLYVDEKGDISYHLVKECDLIDRLWGLRESSYSYIMNIFCNLALDESFKSELSSYLHRIFINLKYNKADRFLYTLAYNWFHSQEFQIRTSLEKLILMQLRESEETDEKIVGYECMLWCRLA